MSFDKWFDNHYLILCDHGPNVKAKDYLSQQITPGLDFHNNIILMLRQAYYAGQVQGSGAT